jgi:two-component system, NtrC family, response regulator AtoC
MTLMKKKPFTAFVVEDDEWFNRLLVHSLSLDREIIVEGFSTAKAFLARLGTRPDLVTLDYRLPDEKGSEVLRKIKDFDDQIEVVVISEQEDIETAVELIKNGAFDYLVKDDNIRQKLVNTLARVKEKAKLKNRISALQKEVEYKYDFQNIILGNSKVLKEVFDLMGKAVETNIAVSVYGETGTGKELVAKAIHYNSARKKKPFVVVNMAAIPAELAESELFGHEKGAFTGAINQRIGKFEEAHEGTLFLDEVAEMSPSLQAKLLRVLQEKEIARVGSNKSIKVDCRIIVATHRNLAEEVKNNRFREDLYYRLLGLPIHLPPLRERGEDILLLARHFSDRFCEENNIRQKSFSASAQNKLAGYGWPGNVRELKSVVELATILSGGDRILEEHISFPGTDDPVLSSGKEMTMKEYNFSILQWYLKKYDHNIPLVSKKLDVSPATIYRMLKQIK